MDRDGFQRWLNGYERAWRSPGTASLDELFAVEATYRHSPYAEPLHGLPAIEADWEAERDGPDEVFTMLATVLAVDGDISVAHVLVRYGEPLRQEYQDLWLAWFDSEGRVTRFEEWPFWPDGSWSAGG
ncbi:MAG: hypothetical protein H0V10_08205 [Geodermatophilaceae bacterium]|nr:hypothetical protein [Geodermatophilaceae bacterium]